jgi:hypothetical protein
MSPAIVQLRLRYDIIEPRRLRAYAQQRVAIHHRGPQVLASLGDCAIEAMIISAPGPTPDEIGCDITSIQIEQIATTQPRGRCIIVPVESWMAHVIVAVRNEVLLCAYASRRFRICWFKEISLTQQCERAVYESLVGSSAGPPPNHYGVRLSAWDYRRVTDAA